jgi:hypothetical protein
MPLTGARTVECSDVLVLYQKLIGEKGRESGLLAIMPVTL